MDKMENKEELEKNIIKRLRRIEGQVKGIQRMIEDKKSCQDILTQVTAAKAALNMVGTMIFRNYSIECIKNAAMTMQDDKLEEMLDVFVRFTK